MGDHRARIKIEMEFHGVKDSADMYVNYWPDGEYQDVDDRIIKFIRDVYRRGMEQYDSANAAREDHERESYERKLLADLKAKYEGATSSRSGPPGR